jgi:hypothetical protein
MSDSRICIPAYSPHAFLKVSYSQEQILNFSFELKNERIYFSISALASKSGLIVVYSKKFSRATFFLF